MMAGAKDKSKTDDKKGKFVPGKKGVNPFPKKSK